jgi:hypothetical protein
MLTANTLRCDSAQLSTRSRCAALSPISWQPEGVGLVVTKRAVRHRPNPVETKRAVQTKHHTVYKCEYYLAVARRQLVAGQTQEPLRRQHTVRHCSVDMPVQTWRCGADAWRPSHLPSCPPPVKPGSSHAPRCLAARTAHGTCRARCLVHQTIAVAQFVTRTYTT